MYKTHSASFSVASDSQITDVGSVNHGQKSNLVVVDSVEKESVENSAMKNSAMKNSAVINRAEMSYSFDNVASWNLLQLYGADALHSSTSDNTKPLRTLPERVAAILVQSSNGQNGVIQGLSFKALADALGTHRETIVSIVRVFRRQGFIDVKYRQLQILDVDSLREFSSIYP